ncbi:MAG TPA: patatin-like phospholipase family protein [Steroidobacteraceae bacterium]|nr:patatin-like phospholipase family protein [Steroidobacteraceae bacterium]
MPVARVVPALVATATLFHAIGAPAQPAPVAASGAGPAAARPRIGLVLSGGGARGAAHIGILKVLESLRVPVDAIAGTSMGAVVGSLYASGMSAAEVEQLIGSIDWQDAFRDRPPRETLIFRRKQDDREFLVRAPIGLRGGSLRFPRGLIQGQKLNEMLRAAMLGVAGVGDFDRLPIPFRAVATDLSTGAPVEFARGDLATAVHASMAAPGVFAPVEIDGRMLVDGGLVENLPVEAVRAMGVDVIIAVDVSSPLRAGQELDSALAVSNQMISILMKRETVRSLALLGARDVVITPDLGSMSSVEFARVRDAIAAGEAAGRAAASRLAALSQPPAEYQRFLARAQPVRPSPTIDFVRVSDAAGDYRKFINAALAPLIGLPADAKTIKPAMTGLYGRDLFETLDYTVQRDGDQTGLEVNARRKSWGPNYLRFGLDLQDDFQGNNNFTAGVRFILTEVNPYMAEWNIDLKVGEQPLFGAEFFQPLGYASPWFVAPRFNFDSRSVQVRDDTRLLAEYRVRETNFGVDFGREFSDWGEIRTGLRHVTGSTHLRIGAPSADLPDSTSFRQGGFYVRLSFDRLDSVDFPRHGELFTLEWDAQRTALGADRGADTAQLDWLLARSLGRNSFIFWTSAGSALSASPGVQNYFPLGGFLSLSGVNAAALSGPHFGIARLIYLRKIGSGSDGLFDVPTYIGLSAEAGNVWQQRGDASLASTRKDGATFVGLETPLGPVYLGAGYDQAGTMSYYLFLGRTF